MTEKLTKAIEATAKNPRSSALALTVVYARDVATLREAAQQVLDQRLRLERLGPERLAEMRQLAADIHDVYRCLAMVRDLLYVIEGDAS